MSRKHMNVNELASMLGTNYHLLTRMARRGEIPCQTIRGDLRFNTYQICPWLKQSIPTMSPSDLARLDRGLSRYRGIPEHRPVVSPLIQACAATTDLDARTYPSLKRKLVALADDTEKVYDSHALLEGLMCSLLPTGAALLHPNETLPYSLAEPVMVIARTQGPVMCNQTGQTDLFFLCAAQDDGHHLHILTRLCRLLNSEDLADRLDQAETPAHLIEAMADLEDGQLAHMA